jgi:AmmeMemoRadiSam system protein A
MGETRPVTVRVGATAAGLLIVGLILLWIIQSGLRRPRSGTLAQAEPTAGGKVGEPGAAPAPVTSEDQRALVRLARQTIEEVVRHGRLPEVDAGQFSERLRERSGCFVTLEIDHRLRGCIGHIIPREPLYEAVLHNARNAATQDTRFDPVSVEELSQIEVEVSVLTVPQPLSFDSPEDLLAKLRPRHDGVVLSMGLRRATFLPQVWDKLPQPETFLQHLSNKAGLGPDGWRSPNANVSIYHVEAFTESELGMSAPGAGEASPEAEP